MPDFIREAGWGVWPVLIFGAGAVLMSLRHLAWPSAVARSAGIGLTVVTVIAGALGFAVGVQKSIGGLDPERGKPIFVLFGVGESLHCVIVALVLACVAVLLLTAGSYRSACRAQQARERGVSPSKA